MPDSLTFGGTAFPVNANSACAPNTAPVAALIAYPVGTSPATPAKGDPPLAIHFDASGSHDPDAGDSIVKYHFDFGDGTSADSTTSTIDHTYTSNGHYAARLTVYDSHNLASSNVATAEIEVELPLNDVVSRKMHSPSHTTNPQNIDLMADPNTGAYNDECRSEGSDGYTIIYSFGTCGQSGCEFTVNGNAAQHSITVTRDGQPDNSVSATGQAGPGPNQYQVHLSNTQTAHHYVITVNGIAVTNNSNAGAATLNNAAARFDLLVGDVNGDGFVLSGDYTATRQRSGAPVNTSTFRYDVNADGFILSGDYSVVRQKSGTKLP
jgi:hypothetical protein